MFSCIGNISYSAKSYAQDDTPSTNNQLTERKFSSDTLNALLIAEFAGSRKLYDVALTYYSAQARATRDPLVAERAAMIARYLGSNTLSLEMSLLWVDTAPKNKDALTNATLALLQAGRLQEAFEKSKRLQILGGEPLYQNIAASAHKLNISQREKLLQSFKSLLPRYTKDEQLLVGIAYILQQQRKFDEAMNYTQKALQLYPHSVPAAILEANLLHDLNRDREAIAKMADLLTFSPDNINLRDQYAHILARYDLALAQQQFAIIAKQQPRNTDAILSLGIIAMERKDYKAAIKAFERLLDYELHLSTAHFYLGQVAENQQNWQEAIFNYLQVDKGKHFLPATMSLLEIFIKQEDIISAQQHMARVRLRFPEEAEGLFLIHAQALIKHDHEEEGEQILNDGLIALPNNSKLLYARAMMFSQQKRKLDAERDLRRILVIEPQNIAALNSLGYLLTDHNERLSEATELLTKAISLKPDDPVILDSLGWLHYRKGKYTEALQELKKAYSSYQEPTVSAHLGEVLWVIGAQDEARQIWQESLKRFPESPLIPATMKRLKAE